MIDRSFGLRAAWEGVHAQFRPSQLQAVRAEPGDLKVLIATPRWTIHRSTDRNYLYGGFARLAEKFRIAFSPADSLLDVVEYNAHYLLRRIKRGVGLPLGDSVDAPRIDMDTSMDAVFAYGLYPRGNAPIPILWEQTFAPQRGLDGRKWRARLRAAFSSCAERATAVVTATDISAQWFSEIFPEHAGKVRAIPYYLPHLDAPFLRAPRLDDRCRIVFVGKEARRKGLDTLAAAWPMIAPEVRRNLSVNVVSAFLDGPVPMPQEWHHSAFVPDVLEVLRSADLLVFPTKSEAYGLVLVEAMCGGCAIITTDAPIQRAIVGSEAGLFIDPTSPHALARAIESFALDRDRLVSAQAAARAQFERNLHPTSVGQAYAGLLFDVAGRTPTSGIRRAAAAPEGLR